MLLSSPPILTPRAGSFCVHGFPFRLRTNLPDAECLFAGLYRDFILPEQNGEAAEALVNTDESGGFSWQLGEKTGKSSSLPAALWNLEAALCETIIRFQRRAINLHAATIHVENSAAMLAGCSHAGKTTLSLALTRRGFSVAGDDVALLEPETLNVLPIPRCFHLDDPGAAMLESDGLRLPSAWRRFRFVVPNDFGVPALPPRPARTLIFMQGVRTTLPTVVPISQAEMTARLLSETGQGPLSDSETIAAICRLAGDALCFALTPGPLGETADAVAALLTDSRAAAC